MATQRQGPPAGEAVKRRLRPLPADAAETRGTRLHLMSARGARGQLVLQLELALRPAIRQVLAGAVVAEAIRPAEVLVADAARVAMQ